MILRLGLGTIPTANKEASCARHSSWIMYWLLCAFCKLKGEQRGAVLYPALSHRWNSVPQASNTYGSRRRVELSVFPCSFCPFSVYIFRELILMSVEFFSLLPSSAGRNSYCRNAPRRKLFSGKLPSLSLPTWVPFSRLLLTLDQMGSFWARTAILLA